MMKRIKILLLAIGVVFAFASLSLAANDVSLSVNVDKKTAYIGSLVKCNVVVKYPKDVKLLSSIKLKTKDFKVQSGATVPQREKGKYFIEEKNYELSTLTPGKYTINPIEIEYLGLDGKSQTVSSQPIKITIESILGKNITEKTDIRDIKNVVGIDPKYQKYFNIGFSVLGAGLILLIVLWVRKKMKKDVNDVRYLLTAYEEAMQDLEKLKGTPLIKDGKIKAFYLRMTDIVRHYFERTFAFSAEELTSEEILTQIKNQNISDEAKDRVSRFYGDCDLVKFANQIPNVETVKIDHEHAREIVEKIEKEIKQQEALSVSDENELSEAVTA